jgi:uncharacterized membrane protein YecN with MAPEG domain
MAIGIPTVTALYGSLNAVLNIALASKVALQRGKAGVSIGEGHPDRAGAKELAVAIRIHANNAEFVPLCILMMLLAELCGGTPFVLHLAGGILLVSRVLHVIGMPRPAPNFFRAAGVGGTWILISALAAWTLVLRMRGQ